MAPAQPFRLGSNDSGADVTLAEPTIWLGYALTATDVKNLRDRIASPKTISPSALALHWSLTGPNGATAVPGDAGLVDGSATGLDLTLVLGSAPTYQGGNLNYSLLDDGCSARVAPSGQGILFKFHDAATNPVAVETMTSNNEQQNLAISGVSDGSPFTLAVGGQVTGPITPILSPPSDYFQWNVVPDATGGIDLAVDMKTGGAYSATVLYEVFDGTTPVGSKTLNQSSDSAANGGPANTGMFNDPTLKTAAGASVRWYPLGRFTLTGTDLRVRVSCPATPSDRHYFNIDCLRVAPVGGTVRVVSAATPPATVVSTQVIPGRWKVYATSYEVAGTSSHQGDMQGLGAGPRFLLDPAAVRAALEDLPSIGVGNLAVTGNGDPASPLVIKFVGALANLAQPLIVPSDPALTTTRVYSGGLLPTFKVNGLPVQAGSPQFRLPYWGEGTHNFNGATKNKQSYMATVYFPFIQSAPAIQYEDASTYLNATSGSWGPTNSGLAADPRITTASHNTATAIWKKQALPGDGAQYRVSVTWPSVVGRSTAVTYTLKNRAGTTLASATVNQTVAPPDDTDRGVTWKVLGTFTLSGISDDFNLIQSNGTSLPMVADVVRYERVSADSSVRIAPGETVTYSAGAGWAATVIGAAPDATDALVANLAGTPLYPAMPNERTMEVGMGLGGNNYYNTSHLYYNIAKNVAAFPATATDSDGYPTKLPSQSVSQLFSTYRPSFEADGKGWPSINPGNYVLIWDGASDVQIDSFAQNGTAVITGTTNNKRFYNLTASKDCYGVANLNIRVFGTVNNGNGTWNADIRNLRLFPILPGVDFDNPPKWHPALIAKLWGIKSLRVMDLTKTIDGNATTFADYNRPESNLSRGSAPRNYRLQVTRFETYTGPQIWKPREGQAWKITTAVPHNLGDGTFISFDFTQPFGNVTYSDGSVRNMNGAYGHVIVLSETELYFVFGPKSYGAASPVTATATILNPTSRLIASVGSNVPISDIIDLCNTIGCDLHFNATITATDDCLTQLGAYIAQNLGAGQKCRAGYTNEAWNFAQPNYLWATREGARLYGAGEEVYYPYYVRQAKRVWDLMSPGFAAAGRPGDFIRLIESQHEYPDGPTNSITSYARSLGYEFDELAIAPYYRNRATFPVGIPSEPAFQPIMNIFTPEQLIDMYEMFSVYAGWKSELAKHRQYLDQRGYGGTKLITYEGGPELMLPYFCTANYGRRSHAVHRHPRFYGFMLNTLRQYEAQGLTLFTLYFMNGEDHVEGTTFYMWSAYTGTTQRPYSPGRPDQDAIQINQFDRLDLIESVTGGAISAWAKIPLRGSTEPTPLPTSPTTSRPSRRLPPVRSGPSPVRIPFRPFG
ncbi:hypothetical protein P12x_006011 (plasmid) [Tundrisphaera lichenicola]|uniref:golvesin C-terminal-like domain-containing protein n=1 Tax=Tundrisphaera lichenicola TaxID=2029860 RepID=UPI003EBED683